jgi:hypothetical protein
VPAYGINQAVLIAMRDYLDRLWETTLFTFAILAAAEAEADTGKRSPDTTKTEQPHRGRSELRHRNLQRYGDNTEQMRAIFDAPNGWTGTLTRFAELVDTETKRQNGGM